MNIIRTIKIKELSGELDSLNEMDKYFISKFNGVKEIKIKDEVYYIKNKKIIFWYHPKNWKNFWYTHKIGEMMNKKFYTSTEGVNAIIEDFFIKHLNIDGVSAYSYMFTPQDTRDVYDRLKSLKF